MVTHENWLNTQLGGAEERVLDLRLMYRGSHFYSRHRLSEVNKNMSSNNFNRYNRQVRML